jgi:hypothetical protein
VSLMDPSTEVGLFAPPICIAVVFLLGWNISRASGGRVSTGRAKALTIYCVALLVVGYAIVWWREITIAWDRDPLSTIFFALGILTATTFSIIVFAKKSDTGDTDEYRKSKFQTTRHVSISVPRRIFSWIVIVWGIAGLVGGVVAIARTALSR